MDELNLQEIEKKLNEQFANGQRLIFWYDADASFETEVDRLQLGVVRILFEYRLFRKTIWKIPSCIPESSMPTGFP